MKWLEIIELRAVHVDQHALHHRIARLLDKMKDEKVIRIFINVRVETDWSIHVQHDSEKVETHGSEAGRRLREIVNQFGLVNHSIWIEQY